MSCNNEGDSNKTKSLLDAINITLCLMQSHSQSYPNSRDAIASKNLTSVSCNQYQYRRFMICEKWLNCAVLPHELRNVLFVSDNEEIRDIVCSSRMILSFKLSQVKVMVIEVKKHPFVPIFNLWSRSQNLIFLKILMILRPEILDSAPLN